MAVDDPRDAVHGMLEELARRIALANEERIAAALRRGDSEVTIQQPYGFSLQFDLSTWPEVSRKLRAIAH